MISVIEDELIAIIKLSIILDVKNKWLFNASKKELLKLNKVEIPNTLS